MKSSRNYKSQINTQSDLCSFVSCLNLIYEIYETTKEKIFDFPVWLMDSAKVVEAKLTNGPGMPEMAEDERDEVATKSKQKFANK